MKMRAFWNLALRFNFPPNYLDAGTCLPDRALARGGLSRVPLEVGEAMFTTTLFNLKVPIPAQI